ncbi:MAG: conjugal transfer protein [Acetatifactor sp.]|nr:conjugal transfer protein [Acetatifactor sp.]
MIDKYGWVHCPICQNKTKTKVTPQTVVKHFPLFCPKCKQESEVNVENMEMTLSGKKK